MRLTASVLLAAVALQLVGLSVTARAEAEEANPLARAVLVEPTSSVFPAADFSVEDFSVAWEGASAPGVHAALEQGTLQWVTIDGGLVLPRAVLRVRADAVESGIAEHAGSAHPLRIDADGEGRVELPVALLSGEPSAVRLRIRRGAAELVRTLTVRFTPRKQNRSVVVVDATCSPYGLRVIKGSIPEDSWLELRCRMVPVQREEAPTAALEVLAYWDNVGSTVNVEEAELQGEPQGRFRFRLEASPGRLLLRARQREVVLGYRLPPKLYAGFVSAGIGPYLYSFEDGDTDLSTAANLLTLYAGYALEPAMRIVFFNAAALHAHFYSDQGLYLWLEQSSVLDGRLSINLLLGMHSLLFEGQGRLRFIPSFPQGVEGVFRDFGMKAHNLSGGAFLYPEIEGRSYYNLWLRWGSARMFGEINYIAWKEPLGKSWVASESLGVTVGVPLLRFL